MDLSIIPAQKRSDLDTLFIYTLLQCKGNRHLRYKLQNQYPVCCTVELLKHMSKQHHMVTFSNLNRYGKCESIVAICFSATTCVITSVITPQPFLLFSSPVFSSPSFLSFLRVKLSFSHITMWNSAFIASEKREVRLQMLQFSEPVLLLPFEQKIYQ